jgi:hypothetical protein
VAAGFNVESPRHSPDKEWWWDGIGWLPAYSSRRDYWFDGSQWRLLSTRSVRFVSWVGVVLCAVGFVGVFTLYPMIADAKSTSRRVDLYAFSIFAAIGVGVVLAALRPIQRNLRITRYAKAQAGDR